MYSRGDALKEHGGDESKMEALSTRNMSFPLFLPIVSFAKDSGFAKTSSSSSDNAKNEISGTRNMSEDNSRQMVTNAKKDNNTFFFLQRGKIDFQEQMNKCTRMNVQLRIQKRIIETELRDLKKVFQEQYQSDKGIQGHLELETKMLKTKLKNNQQENHLLQVQKNQLQVQNYKLQERIVSQESQVEQLTLTLNKKKLENLNLKKEIQDLKKNRENDQKMHKKNVQKQMSNKEKLKEKRRVTPNKLQKSEGQCNSLQLKLKGNGEDSFAAEKEDLEKSKRNRQLCKRFLLCRFIGCREAFLQKKELIKHKEEHSGQDRAREAQISDQFTNGDQRDESRQFKCPEDKCNMTFMDQRKLQIHLKQHQVLNVYSCAFCRHYFSNEQHFLQHLQRHQK